jgi:hypothetical protein
MELMLKNVRIAFCQSALGDAEDYEGNKNFRHSATFIVEPGSDNDKAIQAAIKTEAQALWGKKAEGMLEDMRGSKTQWCYPKNKKDKSGEVYEGFEGMFALGSHRKQKDGKPTLLDNIKDPATGKAARRARTAACAPRSSAFSSQARAIVSVVRVLPRTMTSTRLTRRKLTIWPEHG